MLSQFLDAEFTVFQQYDETVTVERPAVDPDMSVLGPEFGGEAAAVADALADLAERDPDALDGTTDGTIVVEVDGQDHEVPAEAVDFSVVEETVSGEHVTPHVVEPSFGVDRTVYTVLAHALREDEVDEEARTRLALPPAMAPTFVGVFPLMDKDGLGERADEVATRLRNRGLSVAYDDSGSIGRRYRRQDEVGTPYCVTVDYESLSDGAVTLRERDSAEQRRVAIEDLPEVLSALRAGERAFSDVGAAVADA